MQVFQCDRCGAQQGEGTVPAQHYTVEAQPKRLFPQFTTVEVCQACADEIQVAFKELMAFKKRPHAKAEGR